ncbi:DUF262 domain-containing protein [Aliivibrio fischeri]|uniref:DUF262 domain-containing protein n=1 Tax=Aliivibrio fischeri TaxID=668 RepID=UPI0012D91C08|nr:DUF262 domain-containing protein [Aliivibrio fischeri]MUH97617.1 DUF262 domain-containing protein [Aliivibrio fischeri]MUI65654.1 DUF262 domain-containing protein [Aliivibrio fischeri]USR95418.1 DUF262 domain-containing protein [Aliivibrio fischeri ATCC 7744 = JCM 18803 = DSM 507]GGK43725.1 hypothetical protein GCM10007987_28820 [Aliivibrio fischeri]
MQSEELVKELEQKVTKVHTQSLDLSFNELLDMYVDGELDINPEYQRLFRWSEGARSRFIESLLLEMPVPPIYVVEDENGSYQLIDGLQRFSSYLHLRGHLDAEHLPTPVHKGELLKLQDCDIVHELNGFDYDALPLPLKIRLKRAFVRVEVVRKGSDNKFRYHMFKRLNTGGEELTQQQLRNCTIRMLSSDFIDFISKLSKDNNFSTCISKISDYQKLGSFDQELVLRFFALKNWKDKFTHDLADFLTDYMEAVSDPENTNTPFNYDSEEENFLKTFKILKLALGERVFGRSGTNGPQANFAVYQFESICIGIQGIIQQINPDNDAHIQTIKTALEELKKDTTFVTQTTGGGKNSKGSLAKRIDVAHNKFLKVQL